MIDNTFVRIHANLDIPTRWWSRGIGFKYCIGSHEKCMNAWKQSKYTDVVVRKLK